MEVQQINLGDIQNFPEDNRRIVIVDILEPVGDVTGTRAVNHHADLSIAVHIAAHLCMQLLTVQNYKGEDHLKENMIGIISRDTGVGVDHPGNPPKRTVQRITSIKSFIYIAAD